MKFALARRSLFGNEKPRRIAPLTTLNIVVTPQMPSARTMIASAEKARSLRRTRRPIRISCRKVSESIVRLRRTDWAGSSSRRLRNERELRLAADAACQAEQRPAERPGPSRDADVIFARRIQLRGVGDAHLFP